MAELPETNAGPSKPSNAPKTTMTIIDNDEHVPPKQEDFDYNIYSMKTTIAQTCLVFTAITANSSFLKILIRRRLDFGLDYYELLVTLLAISLCFLLIVGLLLFSKMRLNINKDKARYIAVILSNIILLVVFIITILNIFIASYSGPIE
ncbi:ninjurin-1-like [Glandiceps talaboti]